MHTILALEAVPDEMALGQVHREQQRGVAHEQHRAELHHEQRRRGRGGAAVRRLGAPQVPPRHHRALHVARPAVVRRRQVHAPLRPREPAGDADRIVPGDAAAAAVLADPRINGGGGGGDPGTPVPAVPLRQGDVEAFVDAQASEHVAHSASEAAAGVEHRRGHAGELLLLRRLRERYERGEAAREVIGGGGHGRWMGSSGGDPKLPADGQ